MSVRQLPIVEFAGKKWFLDTRLNEFRNVENPHDRIDCDEAFKKW